MRLFHDLSNHFYLAASRWKGPAVLGSVLMATSALGPLLLTGCPANSCFLQICEGKNCKCSISSCQDGAEYNLKRKRCVCSPGHYDVAGQCLTQADANEYCGKGFGWVIQPGQTRGGCVKLQCRPGDNLDETTGLCLPKEQVAAQTGVQLGAGQKLGCQPPEVLVVSQGQGACVPAAQSCAKDEVWNGTVCAKGGECATGEQFDPAYNRCVPYASGGGGNEYTVNVQQWAFSTYGPPNGPGAPGFCSSIAKKPIAFGVSNGAGSLVRVTVNLSFPGGEVAKGIASSVAVYDTSGNAVPPAGAAEAQASVVSLFSPLVAGGGRASSETATTTVKCSVINGSKPTSVPEVVGGF